MLLQNVLAHVLSLCDVIDYGKEILNGNLVQYLSTYKLLIIVMEFERDLRKGYVKHNIIRMYYKFVQKIQRSTTIKYSKKVKFE